MKSVLMFCLLKIAFGSLSAQSYDLEGAWQSGTEENHITMIIAGRYFLAVVQNKKNNTYIGTCGGTWRIEKDQFIEVHEFNTMKPEWIGTALTSALSPKGEKLFFKTSEKTEEFTKIDSGKPGQLAGAWLITGRVTPNGLQKITPGARKTMKILSETRFQWIAYNSETKEFFGTGSGIYNTENGKYTEQIDSFSRDISRIGMKLQFDYSLELGDWHHQGLSSKGDPIDELWTKRENLEK